MSASVMLININTKRLQRLVGFVMARIMADCTRRAGKYGASHIYRSEKELSIGKVEDRIIEYLCGLKGLSWKNDNSIPYYDYRRALQTQLTNKRIRAALKHWGSKGKVITRRHGREGNGYQWVLLAEKNRVAREARKYKIKEERWAREDVARKLKTEETQLIADKLAVVFELASKLEATSNTITITREQAEQVLSLFGGKKKGKTMNPPSV